MITKGDYKRSPFILNSINNFYEQNYNNKKLIIVNQGNSNYADNKDIIEIKAPTNITLGELRNIGLNKIPTNEFVAQWDDDDYRHPNYLNLMLNELEKRNVDGVYLKDILYYSFIFNKEMKTGNSFCTFLFKNIGAFYPKISYAEDLKYLRKYYEKGGKINKIDIPEIYLKYHHDDCTNKEQTYKLKNKNIREKKIQIKNFLDNIEYMKKALR